MREYLSLDDWSRGAFTDEIAKAISVSVRELEIDEKQVPAPIKQGRHSFSFREDLQSYFEQLKRQRK